MQLQRLKIPNFRNLRDFEITFTGSTTDADGTVRTFKSHAVIGQNGSGKSNMIEALVTIFRDLDRYETAKFDYELEFQVRGHQVQVKANKDAFPDIWIKEAGSEVLLPRDATDLCDFYDDPESGERPRGHARKYLPSHVFAYYSGKSDRLEALFQDHLLGYVQHLDESGAQVDSDAMPLVSSKDDSLTKPPEYSDLLLRRLFYCKHPHSRLVLLACLIAPEQRFKSVLTDLKVENVDSVLFTLRKP